MFPDLYSSVFEPGCVCNFEKKLVKMKESQGISGRIRKSGILSIV